MGEGVCKIKSEIEILLVLPRGGVRGGFGFS